MLLKEMKNPGNTKRINKIMESRFGFKIDFDNLSFKKAYMLAKGITEGLNAIKRTHSIHTAERDPQYMEMLMVRESLHQWMIANERKLITESELAKAEATLAAKDVVDSIQDMLEDISKIQNERLPALIDTIRDQISSEKAEAFKSSVAPVLAQLYQALQTSREQTDAAARTLAGGDGDGMDMGDAPAMPGAPEMPGIGAEMPAEEPEFDEFAATDAAAGGDEALGRERR